MNAIDELKLETDLDYRYQYLVEFIDFDEEDVRTIHAAAPVLAPAIPVLVERTYEKLLSFDATARHFVPKQHGCDEVSLEALSQDHAHVRFRKDHLTRYFMNILGKAYDKKMVAYLDMTGKIHTATAGNPSIQVPLVQMNALMGLISTLVLECIRESNLDDEVKWKTARAFQKLFWVQNGLFSRHYVDQSESAPSS